MSTLPLWRSLLVPDLSSLLKGTCSCCFLTCLSKNLNMEFITAVIFTWVKISLAFSSVYLLWAQRPTWHLPMWFFSVHQFVLFTNRKHLPQWPVEKQSPSKFPKTIQKYRCFLQPTENDSFWKSFSVGSWDCDRQHRQQSENPFSYNRLFAQTLYLPFPAAPEEFKLFGRQTINWIKI